MKVLYSPTKQNKKKFVKGKDQDEIAVLKKAGFAEHSRKKNRFFLRAVMIGPANTANTPNGAIPVPVRGSGWPVSEPPISAISHRLSLLIFSRRQFFSAILHSRCQNGFDDSSGLIALCRAGEPLQAAFYGYMQAMFRSCFIRKGKLLFSNQTLCAILLQ